jgi:hypothetical protein
MKRILYSAVAFAIATMGVQAKPDKDDNQRGGDGRRSAGAAKAQMVAKPQGVARGPAISSGGSARASAPLRVSSNSQARIARAPAVSERASTPSRTQVQARAATPSVNTTVRATGMEPQRAVAQPAARTVEPSRTTVDTRRFDNNTTRFNDSRRFDSTRRDSVVWDSGRERSWRNYRYFYAPDYAYRGWDRDRIYSWNNHRYHWYGGSWVLIDPGYDYSTYAVNDSTLSPIAANTVAQVQFELQRAGYDPGPADGVFGSMTSGAIAQYQADHGLVVTGRIDRPLLLSLGIQS